MVLRMPEDNKSNCLLLRVYFGGCDRHRSTVLRAIEIANVNIFPRRLVVETLFVKDIADMHAQGKAFSEEDLATWLSESHIHLIPCHPHQGSHFNWTVSVLYVQLQLKLRFHPRFPIGNELNDPAFTQDKYTYIKALEELATPTVKIKFKDWLFLSDDDRLHVLNRCT